MEQAVRAREIREKAVDQGFGLLRMGFRQNMPLTVALILAAIITGALLALAWLHSSQLERMNERSLIVVERVTVAIEKNTAATERVSVAVDRLERAELRRAVVERSQP